MRLISLVTAAGLALLSACAPRYTGLAERGCDAGPVQIYIGQQASQEIAQRIQDTTRARYFEWIEPDMIVTADSTPWRVRVSIDRNGRITGIRCG